MEWLYTCDGTTMYAQYGCKEPHGPKGDMTMMGGACSWKEEEEQVGVLTTLYSDNECSILSHSLAIGEGSCMPNGEGGSESVKCKHGEAEFLSYGNTLACDGAPTESLHFNDADVCLSDHDANRGPSMHCGTGTEYDAVRQLCVVSYDKFLKGCQYNPDGNSFCGNHKNPTQCDQPTGLTPINGNADKVKTMAAVTQNGNALYFASDELKNDKDVVMAAFKKQGWINVSDEFQTMKEVMMAAVAKSYGRALSYASDELKNDKEVVMAAVAQDGGALEYASDELKNDKEVVMAAVAQKGSALYFASDELKNDKEFMMAIFKEQGWINASDEFQTMKEVMMAAVAQNGNALEYASDELKNDKELQEAAGWNR